jgi:hypothetical protein
MFGGKKILLQADLNEAIKHELSAYKIKKMNMTEKFQFEKCSRIILSLKTLF